MKKERQPLWLVVIKRIDTGKHAYFNAYGCNADEVLTKTSDGFFDAKLLSFTINEDFEITKKLERDKEISFPRDSIKVVCVKKCKNIDEFELFKDRLQNNW